MSKSIRQARCAPRLRSPISGRLRTTRDCAGELSYTGKVMTQQRYTKSNLPEKICAACGRPFAWRKKWARDWDNVKTCSERCKGDLRRKAK